MNFGLYCMYLTLFPLIIHLVRYVLVDRGLWIVPGDLQRCRDQPPPERRLNCCDARDGGQSFPLLLLCRRS